MRLKESFEEFLVNQVNLDQTRVDRAIAAHTTIRERLAALDELQPRFVGTYLQGSYALHTAVRPVRDDHEYDVDVVLVLNAKDGTGRLIDGNVLLDWLCDLLSAIPLYRGKVERRECCLRVRYTSDGQRFHLDVLPSHQPSTDDEAILIPPDWAASHPRGYVRWLNDVRLRRCKRVRHVVRLVKFWRNLQFANGGCAPNSMVLTTLIGLFAPNDAEYTSLDDALVRTMRRINDWLQGLAVGEQVVLDNPSLPGENLARAWQWADVLEFREHFARATRRAEASLSSTDEQETIDIWNEPGLFSGLFPRKARGLGAEAKAVAAAMAAGGLSISPAGWVGASGVPVRDNRGFFGSQ